MTPMFRVHNIPSLAPGQIVRMGTRPAWVIAAIDRETPDLARVVCVGLADQTRVTVATLTTADIEADDAPVEVYDGERILVLFDGLPALAVGDSEEHDGTLRLDGGNVHWESGDGLYRARLTLDTSGRWYAPALDLVILPGEVAA